MPSRNQDTTPTSPKRLNILERRADALELRRAGASYTDIALSLRAKYGSRLPQRYSRTHAYLDVKAELKFQAEHMGELREEVRALELQRLDTMFLGIWPRAEGGSETAIDRCLKIMQRRAFLMGLDAPQKVAETTTQGEDKDVLFVGGNKETYIAALQRLSGRQGEETIDASRAHEDSDDG